MTAPELTHSVGTFEGWQFTTKFEQQFYDAKSPNDEVITDKIYTQDLGKNINSTCMNLRLISINLVFSTVNDLTK